MVPCECGKPFGDLTDWKAHSTTTGHCCTYKCRKLSSATSISGFAFKNHTPARNLWNGPATFEDFRSEGYHPPSHDAWKGLVSPSLDPLLDTWNISTLHSPNSYFPLRSTWQDPDSFTTHPIEGSSLLPNAIWKVPTSSTRQPNLACRSSDGTIWPAPVPLTNSQTAPYYQSLNSRPAPILTAIPHPVVASSTQFSNVPAPMPRQTPPAADSDRSIISPDPNIPKTPMAATSSAPITVKRDNMTATCPRDHRPFVCPICKRAFRVEEGLVQHGKALHSRRSNDILGPTCDTCNEVFPGQSALKEHQRARKHCYCHECAMIFESESAAVKHFKAFHASQFWCCDCEQDFVSERALDQHLDSKVHRRIPCQLCEQGFGSKPALDRHIVLEHHASVNPKRKFYPDEKHACYICQRRFAQIKDLEQHLASLKHRPISDLQCIASDKCKHRFLSPSALLQHLESGACSSGIDRHIVNNFVRENDTGRIISSGPAVLSLSEYNRNPSEYSSSSGTPIFTPTSSASSSPMAATSTDNVDKQPVPRLSLDADILLFTTQLEALLPRSTPVLIPASQVYLDLNKCRSLPSVPARSPSHNHAPALFHCPGALATSTPHGVSPRKFTTLSALAQHVESGACGEGSATLQKAMEVVQERLAKMGFGSVRLLK